MAAPVIIVLGPPGAGKGTQSELLAKRLGGLHLSSGVLMRSSQNMALKRRMATGQLAKSEDFLAVVDGALQALPGGRPLVLDSVGKKVPEAKWLTGRLGELGYQLTQVIYLSVDQSQAVARNLRRGRDDDSPEAQARRWRLYQRETSEVLEFYRQQRLLREVDGSGTVDEVARRVEKALQP